VNRTCTPENVIHTAHKVVNKPENLHEAKGFYYNIEYKINMHIFSYNSHSYTEIMNNLKKS